MYNLVKINPFSFLFKMYLNWSFWTYDAYKRDSKILSNDLLTVKTCTLPSQCGFPGNFTSKDWERQSSNQFRSEAKTFAVYPALVPHMATQQPRLHRVGRGWQLCPIGTREPSVTGAICLSGESKKGSTSRSTCQRGLPALTGTRAPGWQTEAAKDTALRPVASWTWWQASFLFFF